jgi:hypothetical protein
MALGTERSTLSRFLETLAATEITVQFRLPDNISVWVNRKAFK